MYRSSATLLVRYLIIGAVIWQVRCLCLKAVLSALDTGPLDVVKLLKAISTTRASEQHMGGSEIVRSIFEGLQSFEGSARYGALDAKVLPLS